MTIKLDINNFCSFGENIHVEIPEGITLIDGDIDSGGSNGAGKSALFECMTYPVWGKARGTTEYPAGDHLIRDNCNKMKVTYSKNGTSITRERTLNGNSKLNVTQNKKNEKFPTLASADRFILNSVGIEYDTFIKTAYFQQGKDKAFSELTSSEARKKVVELMGLDKWSKYHATVLTRLNEHRHKVAAVSALIENTKEEDMKKELTMVVLEHSQAVDSIRALKEEVLALDEIINVRSQELEQRKKDAIEAQALIEQETQKQQELLNTINEIDKQSKTAWNLMKRVKEERKKQQDLVNSMEELDFKLRNINIDETNAKIEECNINISNLDGQLQINKNKKTVLEVEIDNLSKQLDNLDVNTYGVCPILGSQCGLISHEQIIIQRDNVKAEIEDKKALIFILNETIDDVECRIENQNNKLKELNNTIEAYGIILRTLEGHRQTNTTVELNIKLINTNLNSINELIMLANAKRDALQVELFNIERNKHGILSIITEIDVLVDYIQTDKYNKQNAMDSLDNMIHKKSSCAAKIDNINNKLDEFKKYIEESNRLKDESLLLETLADAFGPNGVPAMIIEATKEGIEAIANNILQYGQQNVSVNILLKEPKKSGDGFKDVFRIMIRDVDGNEIPIFRLSGGEAYWVDLAIRSALFLSWRSKNKSQLVDVLLIDEGIGKIDDVKRRVLIDVLKYLGTKIPYIMIITHTDIKSLKDEFDNIITIKKKNGVSYV